ncbi:MAG: S41 family peptidase [Bacteroidetes bacterium]|nr:S41 family peptidase [Bacteroidota bacterium]
MRTHNNMRRQTPRSRAVRIAGVVGALFSLLLLTAMVEDTVQRMQRGEQLLAAVYQSILNEYVEDVSADELFRAGVKGMLEQLDPYAELIEERHNSEVDVLARGVYSGLGIKVRNRDGSHVVASIYDEIRPLTNLRLGDEILRIDSTDLRASRVSDLRSLLRGQPGTTVQLLVRRPGIADSLELRVLRRTVSIDPLPLADISDDGILYLKLIRFSRSLVDSVSTALRRANDNGSVRGIVLDVRGNPGGLLEAAVAVADYFVEPGTPIVQMRGRQPSYARVYHAKNEPIDADVPIVVIVDAHSASASEILAGALQDLDRAVVIGERTFGKGLVQTLVPLNDNAWLKLTTSRYYTPSGRCIQRYVYPEGRASRVSAVAEGPEFHTLRLKRSVRESNGILPDVTLTRDSLAPLLACLDRHDAYFSFVVRHINRTGITKRPKIDGAVRADFRVYADSLSDCEGDPLSTALRSVREEAVRQGLSRAGQRHIDDVDKEVRRLGTRQFDDAWDAIRARLTREFIFQLEGERARMQHDYILDASVLRARHIVSDENSYEQAMLHGH